MDQDRIDQLFDEAMSRTRTGVPNSDPYGLGPLASDHFLLSKSWTFFKEKIKVLETQYKKIIGAKEEKIQSLEKQIESLLRESAGAVEESKDNQHLEFELNEARAHDFLSFQRDQKNLQTSWDEERIALEEQVRGLEFDVRHACKELEKIQEVFMAREKELLQKITVLSDDKSNSLGKTLSLEKDHSQALIDQQAEVKRRDDKIDLMRAEINRRDELLRQAEEERSVQQKELRNRESRLLDFQSEITKLQDSLSHLEERNRLVTEEKNNMRRQWEEEQSQWRELWERDRELWEKSGKKSPE